MKLGYKSSNKRKFLMISTILMLLIALGILSYSYIKEDSVSLSATGKVITETSGSIYSSLVEIIGFVIEETTTEEQAVEEQQEATEEQAVEEQQEATETVEEQTEEIEEQVEETTDSSLYERDLGEKEENITNEETTEITETNVTIENVTEEDISNENITVINATIIENATEVNITALENITTTEIIEINITNDTIANITEINATIIENITNITLPEINETLVNITEINETLMNITAENITALNITTKQYKAVINRKVKWFKKVNIEDLSQENLILELPKQAENITIKTKGEIAEAEQEVEDYEESINQTRRINLITGQVIGGDSGSEGILVKLWDWLRKLTITGRVIEESELQDEIIESEGRKEINLTNIISQAGKEIAVEYYTDAPVSEEKSISRGKQVIVSGPDELNYTDILAYSILDNKISINNSEKIKLYWMREEKIEKIIAEEAPTEQLTEESNEAIEEEQITDTEIINETEQPTDNSSAELNNLTDIENIIENETKDKEEKQGKNKTKEEVIGQQTSPITALAIKDKEKKNKNNETEQPTDNLSAEPNNLTDNELLNNNANEQEESKTQKSITRTTREEVNFTAYDLDENGMIDYIEWNVPHLSNQTYEIIYISKAEHLDENYTFVEDVYEQVKELDNNYTLIPDRDYIRVTFEKPLDKTKDITIYARVKDACSASENENNSIMINGTEVPCDVYQKKKRIDEIRMLMGEY